LTYDRTLTTLNLKKSNSVGQNSRVKKQMPMFLASLPNKLSSTNK